ncbi:MAG: sigma-70 family RNA polymerase sigma factor [Luteolibacter sp.]
MKEKILLTGKTPLVDATRWVDDHGDCLYRFAKMRVKRTEIAEDLVQDSLLAALRAAKNFSGRSNERTWLIGILKNKIADYFRKLGRETTFTDMEFMKDEMSHKFESGFWTEKKGPKVWQESEAVTYRGEFWQTMRECMDKLPPRVADVFVMREMDGEDTPVICETLGISQSNLWVMLHRARMALRECLEINWFNKAVPRK